MCAGTSSSDDACAAATAGPASPRRFQLLVDSLLAAMSTSSTAEVMAAADVLRCGGSRRGHLGLLGPVGAREGDQLVAWRCGRGRGGGGEGEIYVEDPGCILSCNWWGRTGGPVPGARGHAPRPSSRHRVGFRRGRVRRQQGSSRRYRRRPAKPTKHRRPTNGAPCHPNPNVSSCVGSARCLQRSRDYTQRQLQEAELCNKRGSQSGCTKSIEHSCRGSLGNACNCAALKDNSSLFKKSIRP